MIQECGKGSAKTNEVSVRGEFVEDVWALSGRVAPLSWCFLVRSVSMLENSGILSSLVWVKITIIQTVALIFSNKTSYIVLSFLICPARSGMMSKIMGKFLFDSTYLESPFYLQNCPPT